MRTQNDVRRRLPTVQRAFVVLCTLLLFTFVAIILFWVPSVYAQNTSAHRQTAACATNTPVVPTNTPVPTATRMVVTPTPTPILPTPTPIVPTPTPTLPVPTPTTAPPTPTPTLPVPTPTTAPPTPTPTVVVAPSPTSAPAGTTPTTIPMTLTGMLHASVLYSALAPCSDTPTASVQATSTQAAGGVPGSTTQPPILKVTGTPGRSGVPPTSTNAVSSPTTDTNTSFKSTAVTSQNNGKMLVPTAPEIAIGTSIVGAAVLGGWYVWRRRQGSMLAASNAQASTPSFNTSTSYAQTTVMNGGMVQESGLGYQTSGAGYQGMLPETPPSQQALPSNADMSLEAIMRQAQVGLFALPGKEESS